MINKEVYDHSLFTSCFMAAFMVQAMLAVGFLYPLVLKEQGFSMQTIGFAMALFNAAAILSRPIGGWTTEKYGFSMGLHLAAIICLIATICLFCLDETASIVFFRIGLGISSSIAMVVVSTVQGLVIPEKMRGKLFAVMGTAYILPQLTIVPLSEWLVNVGQETLYLLLPLALMIGSALSGLKMTKAYSNDRVIKKETWGTWRECLSLRGAFTMTITLATFALLNSSMLQYLPLEARGRGLSASIFFTLNATTCIIFRVFGKSLMDRIARPYLGSICMAIMASSLIMAMKSTGYITFCLSAVSYGCGMGLGFPVMLALIPDIYPSRLMPKGSSLGMLAFDIGFLLSPLIIGYLTNFKSLNHSLVLIALFILIMIPLNSINWWLISKKTSQEIL